VTDRAALLDALEPLVADLPDVVMAPGATSTTWSRGGTAFAVLGADAIELRIGPAIAEAAIRTPDTRAAARGVDWVEFTPIELDAHALDRLEAWFGLAYRRARA
jgi:hypothetical protein